jgi:hypothetical protein
MSIQVSNVNENRLGKTLDRSQRRPSIHEIAPGIHRISIPVPPEMIPGGFSFNQYLVVDERPLVSGDILTLSEVFRHQMDYFSHARNTPALIEKLAQLRPERLACMHDSAWSGDGAGLRRKLDQALAL